MPRPQKWRRVEFIPSVQYFIPSKSRVMDIEENVLRIEEAEAIRLKDVEKLEQEECAEKMAISRQTFQRILNSAREKIADSIINGKSLCIEGGNFTRHICPVQCLGCRKEWKESYENFEKIIQGNYICPNCNSKEIVCLNDNEGKFCKRNCWRKGRTR